MLADPYHVGKRFSVEQIAGLRPDASKARVRAARLALASRYRAFINEPAN
jgi:hypothetical protein